MPKGIVDFDALRSGEAQALRDRHPPNELPFNINKIGHVVLLVTDLERSVDFYTKILGFKVSDVYPDSMVDGRMVFMRCNADHHGVALVGAGSEHYQGKEIHHLAFEVSTLDEVLRAREHLRKHRVKIDFDGRRRAGAQVAVEFRDPDNYPLEIYWGLDQVGDDGKVRPPEEWREEFSIEAAIDNPPPGQDTTLADPGLLRARDV